jgi:hypothetical protein
MGTHTTSPLHRILCTLACVLPFSASNHFGHALDYHRAHSHAPTLVKALDVLVRAPQAMFRTHSNDLSHSFELVSLPILTIHLTAAPTGL